MTSLRGSASFPSTSLAFRLVLPIFTTHDIRIEQAFALFGLIHVFCVGLLTIVTALGEFGDAFSEFWSHTFAEFVGIICL